MYFIIEIRRPNPKTSKYATKIELKAYKNTQKSLTRFVYLVKYLYIFFHSFATAGNNFFTFFHRGNNTPVFLFHMNLIIVIKFEAK